MLVKNPLKRLSLIELLSNRWLKKFCKSVTKPKYVSPQAVKNLMIFNSERKLEQALNNYINNKISIDRAAGKLLYIFEEMDQQGDGELPLNTVVNKF